MRVSYSVVPNKVHSIHNNSSVVETKIIHEKDKAVLRQNVFNQI